MKNKKEIIQELPEEMKCLDTSDIGNWEDIIISMGIKELSEEDTNILSYIPEGNRFNIQFKNFKYLPRFNEHKGFKMLKRFLNKFYFGTYFMDVEIYESNNANV